MGLQRLRPIRQGRALVTGVLLLTTFAACSAHHHESELVEIRRFEDRRTAAGDSLLHYLDHHSEALRGAAARALGRIGDPGALEGLTRTLREDGSAEVRAEAAFALGLLGHPDALPALAARVGLETEPEVQAEVALAIGRIGEAGSSSLIAPWLESPFPRVREDVLEALALLADSSSVDLILPRLDDPVESVAWRAAYALEKIPGQSAVPRLMGLMRSSSAALRSAAIRSLGRLKAEVAAPLIAQAIEDHPAPRTRVRIADALGRIGVASTIPTLIALLDDDFHVRETALRALARMEARSALASVLPLREDPSVSVRAAAYECSAILLGAEAYDVLRRGLEDSSEIVVAVTLAQLGRCKEEGVVDLLLAYLHQEDPLALRAAATEGLARLGDRAPLNELRALLKGEDWVSASVAATALGELKDLESVADLLQALDREGPGAQEVRWAALQSLGILSARSAVPRLRQALREEADVRLRLAAREALEKVLDDDELAHLPTPEEIRFDVRPVHRSPQQPRLVAKSRALQLILHCPQGRVVIDLYGEDAPQMVENFGRLAERGFFDGLTFHRVVGDFVVQGGDPLGNGWGDPGYTVRSEFSRRHFGRGTVGVAHSGKDTGSCQLFITHSPQHHLDARYTIIGQVVTGMDVVDAIDRGDRFTAEVKWDSP